MLATNSSFETNATKNRDVGLQRKKIVTAAVEHEMPPPLKKTGKEKKNTKTHLGLLHYLVLHNCSHTEDT